jgi:hypothetical protein
MVLAPARERLFGNAMLLAFLIAQALDGALTYLGVMSYGVQIEGNPIVAWYIGELGAGLAIVGAKGFATVCAATLHFYSRHRTVGLLTILYLAAAIWPWMRLLSR